MVALRYNPALSQRNLNINLLPSQNVFSIPMNTSEHLKDVKRFIYKVRYRIGLVPRGIDFFSS